jgi:hypothetical protein
VNWSLVISEGFVLLGVRFVKMTLSDAE